MASSDWSVLVATNISHSLVDTLGLTNMDQNYCWNVRTTASPGTFAVRNTTVGQHLNGNNPQQTNLKIQALVRKTHVDAIPYLYIRGNAITDPAYKFAFRQDGKFALYKENLSGSNGNFSSTAIAISASTFAINTTYHVAFLVYSQPNNDTFIEAYQGDLTPYNEGWTALFKTMIFYSDSPITAGYCGFGHYSNTINANSYFDLFEVYEEA